MIFITMTGEVIDPAKSESNEWVQVPFTLRIITPWAPYEPRKLHNYRISFLNSRYDCRNVIISAYSKRHAKKLARKICRITEWLGVEKQ